MSFLRKLLLFFGLLLVFSFQTNARSQTVTQRLQACNSEKATCERKLTANTKELKDCKKGNQGSNGVANALFNCKSNLKYKTDAANKCTSNLHFSQLAATRFGSQLSFSEQAKKRCQSDLDSTKAAVVDCKRDEIAIKDTLRRCTDNLRLADHDLGKMPSNLYRITFKNETKSALQAKRQCLEKADKLEHKLKYECRARNGAGGSRTSMYRSG